MKKFIFSILMLAMSLTASAKTKGYYRGDINGDGSVTIGDVALLVNVLNGKATATSPCNVDGDTDVDLDDLSALIDIVMGKTEKVWVTVDSSNIPSGGGTTDGGITDAEAKPLVINN